jgi:Tfp pilus assembly protein PilX
MRRFTRRGDDSGASLIFALIIVVVVALLVTVVLTFADTSLRATQLVRTQSRQLRGEVGV